jgi:hypothetical protein
MAEGEKKPPEWAEWPELKYTLQFLFTRNRQIVSGEESDVESFRSFMQMVCY